MTRTPLTHALAAILSLGLAACSVSVNTGSTDNASASPSPAPAPAAASRDEPGPDAEVVKSVPLVNIAPDGLSFVDAASGRSRNIEFGVSRDVIETAVTAALGNPSARGHSSECGAGPVDSTTYANGLQLTFQDGTFAGWTINRGKPKGFTTASGIGIGSTRAEVADAYDIQVQETSLGTQFGADMLAGLFDGTGQNAKVTDIWAGTVCLID